MKILPRFRNCFSFSLFFTLSGFITFSLPAYGISSYTNFKLNNFSHTPHKVGVNSDIDITAISKPGSISSVTTTADFNNIFVSKQSKSYSQLYSETNVVGRGSNYFGQGKITSKVVGEFLIPAKEEFSFNYQGLLNTKGFINDTSQESYKTVRQLSLTLINQSTQNLIYNLNITNRNKPNQNINKTIPKIQQVKKQTINNYQFQLNSTKQIIQTSFQGQFQESFSQDTQVGLYAVTQNQSCLYNVKDNSTCNSPPQSYPSASVPFRPSMKIGTLLLLSFLIIKLVKKHIIQLSS